MSIIPFVLNKNNGSEFTIVPEEQKRACTNCDNSKHLVMRQMDIESLERSSCNISYDLHVGDSYVEQAKRDKMKSLKDGDSFLIKPRHAVIIYTQEQVEFPPNLFGIILPKVSLLQYGISNTCSKIDPGYSGKLLVTLFNLGTKTLQIKKGDAVCSLALLSISKEYNVIPYSKTEKSLSDTKNSYEEPQKKLYAIRDWVNQNPGVVAIFIAIFSSVIITIIKCLFKLP